MNLFVIVLTPCLYNMIVVNMLVWAGMPQYNKLDAELFAVFIGAVVLCIAFDYLSYLLVEKHSVEIEMLLNIN